MPFRSLAASIVMYTRSYRTVLLKPFVGLAVGTKDMGRGTPEKIKHSLL